MFSLIKKASSLLLCSSFLCGVLAGCSVTLDQDKYAKVGKPVERPEEQLQTDKIYQLGETVSTMFPDNLRYKPDGYPYASMEYTLQAAALYEHPEEAGIDMGQVLVNGEVCYDLETEVPYDPDYSQTSFLLCDVLIRNPGIGYPNITELGVVCRMNEEGKLGWTGYPAYFSMPEEARDDSDGYNYFLPVGQSMEAKVGWWIDMEQCKKENLYLSLNHGSEESLEAYWELKL